MTRFFAPVLFAFAAAGAPSVVSAQSGYGHDGRTILCASDNNRSRTCRIDTRGGVRLVSQESRAPCIRGRTWNYNAGGIWVGHGCRARFHVGSARAAYVQRSSPAYRYPASNSRAHYGYGYAQPRHDDRFANPVAAVLGALLGTGSRNDYRAVYSGRQPQVFRCESDGLRPRFCRLPFHAQRIDLHRQLSRTHCAQGYNWGWRSDGVWVERGCRAEFVVY